jgi:hypothetical protein
MIVPGTWQGSVEHFYHFLLGYFMPTILWQETSGSTTFSVRDCGPLNSWFGLFRANTDLEVMKPGQMLQRFVTHRQRSLVVRAWDDPRRFHRRALERFTQVVLTRVQAHYPANSTPQITILDRASSPAYYLSGHSEAHGSAGAWRSIPKLTQISEALKAHGAVRVIDTAALLPEEQIQTLAATDILVAQHGAGLSNSIWMRPGSCVVEIQPPQLPTVDAIYSNLASARTLRYTKVEQKHDHAPVDPNAVRDAVRHVTDSCTPLIPPMPGSWPIRMLRQLPRRL